MKFDFIAITDDIVFQERVQEVCNEFNYTFNIYPEIDKIKAGTKTSFVLLVEDEIKFSKMNLNEMGSKVQELRHYFPYAYITLAVNSSLDDESFSFLKKSGLDLVILKQEILNTSKLEFVSIETVFSNFIPIKSKSLLLDSKINFPIFHFMPKNEKFLKVFYPDWELNKERKAKLDKEGELYIHRNDISLFSEYLANNPDKSYFGLSSRCRVSFLSMQKDFLDLILILTDCVHPNSFKKGKERLDEFYKSFDDLLLALGSVNSTWEIVNNTSHGSFGTVQRTPAIIASVGVMALNLGLNNINDILLGTLISDISFISFPYSISKKVKDKDFDNLSPEELSLYHNHPVISLNLALSKRIPINEDTKNIVLCSHEKADRTGFPKKPLPEKIPFGAQLILFAETLDSMCLSRMGESKKDLEEEKIKLINNSLTKRESFSFSFISEIKKSILEAS